MVEYLGKALHEDRLRRREDAQCPARYCRQEFKAVDPSDKPYATWKV